MNDMTQTEKDAKRYQALYESMCKAADAHERRGKELSSALTVANQRADQLQQQLANKDMVIQQEMNRTNGRMNALLEENNQLRETIRELKRGHHD
jgi:hypothetical protein